MRTCRFWAALVVLSVVFVTCAAARAALKFDSGSQGYELRSAALDGSENVTVEAWVRPGAGCPEGATIVDKRGTGSQLGYRMEMGAGGAVRFVTTAAKACEAEVKLPGDRVSQVVGVFSPRTTEVAIYVDGKLAGGLPRGNRGYDRPTITVPLRVGVDQDGGRKFVGEISRVAVFTRALTAEEVGKRFSSREALANEVGDWDLAAGAPRRVEAVAGDGKAVLVMPLALSGAGDFVGANPALTLWYPRPAREWVEALPLGNGRMGAMVFGGVEGERLQLNEDTIWQGSPYEPANPAGLEAIKKARGLVLEGKAKEADEVLRAGGMGKPSTEAAYQTLGSLLINFPESDEAVSEYRRSLDIDRAVATTTFVRGGVKFTREAFVSAPDQVVVLRLTADQAGALSFATTFTSPHRGTKLEARGSNELVFSGTGSNFQDIPGKVRFQSVIHVAADGGSVAAEGSAIKVEKADAVTVFVSCGTNFVNYHDLSADPARRADGDVAAAAKLSYAALLARHVGDYQKLFRRVSIDLGRSSNASLPTDERVRRFGDGTDTSLAALFYQYGRYLLIASSRPGDQPANLQGVWNEGLSAPWGGKYTVNINTEMNYWPAETTNLAECAEPLFQLVRDISETGQKTAKVMYGARGWVCHHNTDVWRATAPIDWPSVGMWPTGGAWLSTHLWQHYLFTGDKAFLEKAYPIFKGACEFFLDTLVEDPKSHYLVTCPSISPESGGLVAGPSMDMQILRDLFAQTARASEILGTDEEFRGQVLAARARLVPYRIGKYGQLQEWMEDKDREFDGNRHSSHLYALFPSAQINPEMPKEFAAAKKSLIGRGDGATGWALAWKINLWARALDGDHAYKLVTVLLTPPKGGSQGGGTYPNLFDAHPPFQIDGNFGATSGMTEMLLQSQEGFMRLLPALPKAWPGGSVSGLCARDGFVVDLVWKDGALARAALHSRLGHPCRIKSAGALSVKCGGDTTTVKPDSAGVCEFPTEAGKTYVVTAS